MNTNNPSKGKMNRKKLISRGVIFCLVIAGGFMIASAVKEIMYSFTLQNQLNAAKKDYETVSGEQDKLIETKTQLQDPEYVQNYARGSHLLSSEDEEVFILLPNE